MSLELHVGHKLAETLDAWDMWEHGVKCVPKLRVVLRDHQPDSNELLWREDCPVHALISNTTARGDIESVSRTCWIYIVEGILQFDANCLCYIACRTIECIATHEQIDRGINNTLNTIPVQNWIEVEVMCNIAN